MQRYIKFVMSKGDPIVVEKELAEALLNSEGQVLMIPAADGSWTGKTINKAHIVSTDYDLDRERSEAEKARMRTTKLEAGITEDQRQRQVGALNKMRDRLIGLRVIKK